MAKTAEPLNPKQLEALKAGDGELVDGQAPGLRVSRTAAGLSWGSYP